ncbi:MAG: 23S rRNA (cytosine1962-C5)-methyltransferase [Saprospiraceae bacterium]|jgi:23S rRNA (cytosine1962-C5)-methyltransferase
MNRIAIKLKPAAERMVKKGHPWVFEGSITKQSSEGKPGDLAIIYDNKKNKFLACGFYDPDSPIRVKLLQYHQTANIDKSWFQEKIKAAFEIRKPLLLTDTNSYRLIYGENDGLPGLIADIYDKVLVLKIYSAIWFPYLELILPELLAVSACKTAVLRLSRSLQNNEAEHNLKEGQVLSGVLESEVVMFKEHGLSFSANVIHGHKTGYFLDHRNNRKKVGELAKNKKVLDVFSYAGGFSVHALAGGAKEVISIDISAKALAMAQQNAALNPHEGMHIIVAIDAFKGMEALIRKREQFDLIIIDPPSFAKRETEIEKAKTHYHQLAALAAQLVKKDGTLLLASCSSRVSSDDFFQISENAIRSANKEFELIEKTFHDVDHPVKFPEGAYLKSGYYRVF